MKQLYAATKPILNELSCAEWSEPIDWKAFEWYPGWAAPEKKNIVIGPKRND